MIVMCDECGKKYQVDVTKIKGEQVQLKCQACEHQITVHKPQTDTSNLMDNEGVKLAQTGKSQSGTGLTAKVILLMLLVSLLPGAVYFTLSFRATNSSMVADTTRFGQQLSNVLADEVDEWIDKNVRVLNTLAQLPAIKSMNRDEQEGILEVVQQKYPWMYLVFTTDISGKNIARNDGKDLKDYSSRQYVKDVILGNNLAWQNLIGKTSKKPALVLAVPIKKDKETIGVLAAAMTRDAISERVTNFKQGESGFVFLVDQKGKVVAHQNPDHVKEQKDMNQHPLINAANNSIGGMVEFKDSKGNEAIGFSRKTKLDWILAMQQNKNEAFAVLKKAQSFALTLLTITAICIVIIAYIASRAIVTPIRKLTNAANLISMGELDVKIENKSRDEIGDLADAISRMQASIKLSINRLKRKK